MMKKRLIFLSLCLSWTLCSFAQRVIAVDPGVGTLNNAIFGDTTATGERVDVNTIYELRRGFPYLLTASLQFEDFNLHIRAEEGAGTRPLIIQSISDGGEAYAQHIRINGPGNITLEGLHISGRTSLGSNNGRIVRVNTDSVRLTVDDCIFEDVGQSIFRIQGDNPNIYITNSLFTKIGQPSNPDNGRFIDNRGGPIDTLLLENNVMYNATSRFYRNGGGASIHWARINQNTLWFSGQQGLTLDIVTNLEFTNNIVANIMAYGRDSISQDTLPRYQLEIDTFIQDSTSILVSHNNFFSDPEIINAFPDTTGFGDTLITLDTFLFDPEVMAAITATGTLETNISEDLEFTDEPIFPLDIIAATVADTTGDGLITEAPPWDFSDLNPFAFYSTGLGVDIDRYTEFHDFSYPNTAVSATAGDQGQAIGANFDGLLLDAPDLFVENQIIYYPNPVRDQLFIQNLDQVRFQRVILFDLQGRMMQSLNNVQDDTIILDTSDLPAGTYVLSLLDDSGNLSSRKIVKQGY